MNPIRHLMLPLVVLAAALTSAAVAEPITCTRAAGCEVRIWNPTTQLWGPVEAVPNGTIVDTRYAIGWGAGWQ